MLARITAGLPACTHTLLRAMHDGACPRCAELEGLARALVARGLTKVELGAPLEVWSEQVGANAARLAEVLGVAGAGGAAPRIGPSSADVARALLAGQARMSREAAKRLRRRLERADSRESLADFCREAWKVLHPREPLHWSWHHDALCDHVQWILEGWIRSRLEPGYTHPVRRLLINVPPSTLKTEILMIFAPAWMWTRWPSWRVLCLSSNPRVALDSAVASRKIVESRWYRETFQVDWTLGEDAGGLAVWLETHPEDEWDLADDQNAKSNFATSVGGGRQSHGITANVVGEHADAIFLDDPNDPHEAQTESARVEVQQKWDLAIKNRVTDPSTSVWLGIQQRIDREDWTAHVTKSADVKTVISGQLVEGWCWVVLPLEQELERRCRTPMPVDLENRLALVESKAVGTWQDPRAVEGEVLHPRWFTPEVVTEKKGGNHRVWVGQYQQRPEPREGGSWKRNYFRFYRLAGRHQGDRPRPDGCVNEAQHPAYVVREERGGGWLLDWLVVSLDAANRKTKKGSRFGMVALAGQGARRFIIDDRSRRGDHTEICAVLRAMIVEWRPGRLIIEAKASGPAIATTLRDDMANGAIKDADGVAIVCVIEELEVDGDKEDRFDIVLPQAEANLVYLPEGAPWVKDYVDEICGFPAGASDRVDSTTQVLGHPRYRPRSQTWGKANHKKMLDALREFGPAIRG